MSSVTALVKNPKVVSNVKYVFPYLTNSFRQKLKAKEEKGTKFFHMNQCIALCITRVTDH